MQLKPYNRRRFLKTGLAAPIMTNLVWQNYPARAISQNQFLVPETIHAELVRLYGEQANDISETDKLKLMTPSIAENGAMVPVGISGPKGLVSSLALFVEKNSKQLITTCTLHDGADLDLGLRIKMKKSSDFYLIAQTSDGLLGVKKLVKYTIGCGGG